MITRMTTAWGAGVTNLVVNLGIFLTLLCVLAAGIAFYTGQTFPASLSPAITSFVNICVVWAMAFWVYNRLVGGRVLVDCGADPQRKLGLFLAAFFLFDALSGVLRSGGVSFSSDDIRQLALAVFLIYTAFSRLQIRENGIWEYGSLIRWHKIVSYSWADDGTLALRAKSLLMVLPRKLLIPPEQGDAVTALLAQHAPQARES